MKINNEQIVSIKELNEILTKEKEVSKIIRIDFQNPVARINIVFIAGLLLLNRTKKQCFEINYPNVLEPQYIFEIRQYLIQYERLFLTKWTAVFLKFKGITSIKDNEFLASESFAPILLINKNTIETVFNTIYNNSTIDSSSNNPFRELTNNYFKNKFIGTNKREIEYLNSRNSIIIQVQKSAPIYCFVFALLYNKISPFKKTNSNNSYDPVRRTEELWRFTIEYINGLNELAKNIVEHSGAEGMITIRVYENQEIELTKGKIFETHVFDFGDSGIIPKLTEDTKDKISVSLIYKNDYEILTNKYKLKHFIKPTATTILNQQIYRDLAHYGLMKFFKLIERNSGLVTCSSKATINTRDTYPENDTLSDENTSIGTSYYFQLPFNHYLFQNDPDETKTATNIQGSQVEFRSITTLLEIHDSNNILFLAPKLLIKERKDELSLYTIVKKEVSENSNTKYLAIDMKDISISESSLLRFLAYCSTNFTNPLIIYNLDYELYNKMIEDNINFYSTLKDLKSVPYWYGEKGILIYSTLKGTTFSFADILYGENIQAFQAVNQIVNHTFPNTTTILSLQPSNIDTIKEIPGCIRDYFYQFSLIPFDLLLKQQKKNLFLGNLETLLNHELI